SGVRPAASSSAPRPPWTPRSWRRGSARRTAARSPSRSARPWATTPRRRYLPSNCSSQRSIAGVDQVRGEDLVPPQGEREDGAAIDDVAARSGGRVVRAKAERAAQPQEGPRGPGEDGHAEHERELEARGGAEAGAARRVPERADLESQRVDEQIEVRGALLEIPAEPRQERS